MIELVLVFCIVSIVYYFIFFYNFSSERETIEKSNSDYTVTIPFEYNKEYFVPLYSNFSETKTFRIKRKRNKRIHRIPLYIKKKRST